MEANKSEIDDIIDPTSSAPLPSPLSAKECECGCGNKFYPRRRDNIYLSKQHAGLEVGDDVVESTKIAIQ